MTLKRSWIKRGTTRLRPVSKKNGALGGTNQVAYREELKWVAAALQIRARHRCEHPRCRGRKPLDPHHIEKRSQGGVNAVTNLVMLCRDCHNWTDESSEGRRGRLVIFQKNHLTHPETFGFSIMKKVDSVIDGTDVVFYTREA